MGLTRDLYRAARTSNTMGALASGNPRRIASRGRNASLASAWPRRDLARASGDGRRG